MSLIVPENAVFISVGSGLTSHQESFVTAIEAFLLKRGLRFITLGRNMQGDGGPLEAVHTIVTTTVGTLVIVFARLRVISAVEYPAAEAPLRVARRDLPTVWNQIEAAMAYQAGKPLLIFLEEGVHAEGIIDPSVHPCLIFNLPPKPGSLPTELRRTLSRWIASLSAKR